MSAPNFMHKLTLPYDCNFIFFTFNYCINELLKALLSVSVFTVNKVTNGVRTRTNTRCQ